MPKKKMPKKVDRNWRKESKSERNSIMRLIVKGRKAGKKWNDISKEIFDALDTYISPGALEQRLLYAEKKKNLAKIEKFRHEFGAVIKKDKDDDFVPVPKKIELKVPQVGFSEDLIRAINNHINSKVKEAEANFKNTVKIELAKAKKKIDDQYNKIDDIFEDLVHC